MWGKWCSKLLMLCVRATGISQSQMRVCGGSLLCYDTIICRLRQRVLHPPNSPEPWIKMCECSASFVFKLFSSKPSFVWVWAPKRRDDGSGFAASSRQWRWTVCKEKHPDMRSVNHGAHLLQPPLEAMVFFLTNVAGKRAKKGQNRNRFAFCVTKAFSCPAPQWNFVSFPSEGSLSWANLKPAPRLMSRPHLITSDQSHAAFFTFVFTLDTMFTN